MEEQTCALVVCGPLGSGKTTLLNTMIHDPRLQGSKLVVVNDVGEMNVDAERLKHVGDVHPLTAGCIGCSDLPAFLNIIQQAKMSGVEHLIVEPTGIADPTEIQEAMMQCEVTMFCVTLQSVEHFAQNRAMGLMEPQLMVADVVALTWWEEVLGLSTSIDDERLSDIVAACGEHTNAPICLLPTVGQQLTVTVDYVVQTYVDSRTHAAPESTSGEPHHDCHTGHCEHNHGHGHHHHKHHHNHGTFAYSGKLGADFDPAQLMPLLARYGEKLIRAKGVVWRNGQLQSFDYTHGRMRFSGQVAQKEPIANFILTEAVDIPELQTESVALGDKKERMRRYQAPLTDVLQAIEKCLQWYPEVVTPSGLLRVDCEADVAWQLAQREGMSSQVRKKVLHAYTDWRLAGLRRLQEYLGHQEFSYWRRRLGAVLCCHAHRFPELHKQTQIDTMIEYGAPQHALEGLLELDALSFLDERAEERPEVIADVLAFGRTHGCLDERLIQNVLAHCVQLSAGNQEWLFRWQQIR